MPSAGIGAFVDDTRVTTTGGVFDADGFEGATSLWTIAGRARGQPAQRRQLPVRRHAGRGGGVGHDRDSVLLGYGIEQLATPAEQADVLGRIMQYLLA